MARTLPLKLSVTNKTLVSSNMLRITLAGEDLNNFPRAQESGYLKLHFAKPDSYNGDIEKQINSDDPLLRPLLRTYTIRQQRYSPNQIDIDFVIHDTGPASQWAANCSINHDLYVAGPGKKKLVDPQADWFFIAGDMTALPAISVNIEQLPVTAKGYAVIEIMSDADKQNLAAPKDFQIHWIVKNKQNASSAFIETVKQLKIMDGKPSVWLACEFSSMRNLRSYFLKDLEFEKRDVYASSYWKLGANEEEHKKIKAMDNTST